MNGMVDRLELPSGAVRRVPQQARSRARLAKLLTAADHLLAVEGAEALTTTRVAAEAGVSVGSLYQYLPDRGAILTALALTYLAKFEERMAALVERVAAEPVDDLPAMAIDAFAEVFRTEPGYRALWFSRHLTEETRAADREHNLRMAAGIRQLIVAQGLLPDSERLHTASIAAQLIADTLMLQAFRDNPEGDEAILDEAKTALRGYLTELVRQHS